MIVFEIWIINILLSVYGRDWSERGWSREIRLKVVVRGKFWLGFRLMLVILETEVGCLVCELLGLSLEFGV